MTEKTKDDSTSQDEAEPQDSSSPVEGESEAPEGSIEAINQSPKESKSPKESGSPEESGRPEESESPEESGCPEVGADVEVSSGASDALPDPPKEESPQKSTEKGPSDEASVSEEQVFHPLTASNILGPRQISIYRDRSQNNPSTSTSERPIPVLKEEVDEDDDQWNALDDDDALPGRSPLSSGPFFMWGAVALIAAIFIYLFWNEFAAPVLWNGMDGDTRNIMLAFLSANSRALGMLLASCITLTAIAIPLTANNYTSKLIGLFTNSKVNRSMFALLILANAFNLLALLLFGKNSHWPLLEVTIAGILGFLCYVLVIPYAFYVFHFLQPDEIISHIEREVIDDLLLVKRSTKPDEIEALRKRIIQNLKNLSNIALRALERYDRDTAAFAVEGLRHIVHYYFAFKHEMPEQWFRVSRMYFLSLSGEMRRRVEGGKTFLEAEVLEELSLLLGGSFGKLRDMVRMISRTVRHIGVEANEKQLMAVLELMSLYFNTFLRAAISRREPEAVYMIVYHYRRMAEEMLPTNENRPIRVAYYLSYYGHQAVRSGMIYVANLVSFDLGHMTALAYEQEAPSRKSLLDIFMAFDEDERTHRLPGVIKSRIKLAVFLHHLRYPEETEMICESMQRYPYEQIKQGMREISEVKTPMFWEVTDRHRHNDYLAPTLLRSFGFIKRRIDEIHHENQDTTDDW